MTDVLISSVAARLIIVVVFAWRIVVSVKRGFAKELSNFISVIVAFIAFKFLVQGMQALTEKGIGKTAYSIAMLAVVFIIYKLVKLFLGALRIFSKLPVIDILDKILGLAAGAGEAVLILMLISDVVKKLMGIG